jgi:hypothetical protein
MFDLSSGPKKAVAFSSLAALIVALATIADLIVGYPFAGTVGFDILFLLSAANVLYLAYDTWRDLVPRRRVNRKHAIGRKRANERAGWETAPPVGNAGRRTAGSRFAAVDTTINSALPRGVSKPSQRNFGVSVPGSSRI